MTVLRWLKIAASSSLLTLCSVSLLAQTYTSVVVFGDSLSDTGNVAHLAQSQFGVRYPSTPFNYADGRFTDDANTTPPGKAYSGVWVEQLAAQFAAKPAVKNSLDGGTNFAFGDATTADGFTTTSGGPASLSIPNMGQQVTTYLASNPTPTANTLYVVFGGGNDLFADSSTAGAMAAAQREANLVQRLVAAGATKFLVPNLPPLGGSPGYNTGTNSTALNAASVTFRAALATDLQTVIMAAATSGKTITIAQPDLLGLITSLASNPAAFGFTNLTASAQALPVPTADTYLFWDTVHPTTTGHHVIALVAENLLAPLVSSSTALTITPALTAAGQTVTLKAVVTGTGPTAKASGLVLFVSGSGATATPLASAVLDATGTGTATYVVPATGSPFTITAYYAGDLAYLNSASAPQNLVVGSPLPTSTTLSASSTAVNAGAPVTFTATVASSTGTPGGTVTFSDGSTSLGTGTLAANGTATLATSTLAAGSHSITASYAASGIYAPSTSSGVTVVVTAPAITFAFAPSTLTVPHGSTGTSTLTLTPVGGASGTVTLGCGTLPAHMSCSFSPSSFTISGTSAATSTLTIGTTATSALVFPPLPGTSRTLFTIYAAALLPLFGFGAYRRRKASWFASTFAACVLFGAIGFGVTGCSSSSSTPATTAAGSYTVNVTATIAGTTTTTSQSTLTVVVQ